MDLKDLPKRLQHGDVIELVKIGGIPTRKTLGYYLDLNEDEKDPRILISSGKKESVYLDIDKISLPSIVYLIRYDKKKINFTKIKKFAPIELSLRSEEEQTKRVGYFIGAKMMNKGYLIRLSPKLERVYIADGTFEKNSGIGATNIRYNMNDSIELLERSFLGSL